MPIPPKLTVLISDSQPFVRSQVRHLITSHGLEVVGETKSGQESIDFYREHHPDLIFLDASLPEQNGLEVLKQIRHQNSSSLVYLFSAVQSEELSQQVRAAGGNGVLSKPIRAAQLNQILEAA